MTDTQAKLMHSRIWDLLSDYADIREELEDALLTIMNLYEDLETSVENIGNDLDDIGSHLAATGWQLERFRTSEPVCVLPWEEPSCKEKEALPWN